MEYPVNVMLELRFRKMVKADLPVITKIENDCQSHPWKLLQFLDGFNAGHDCWIASKEYEQREILVGFSVVATAIDESTLLNICVRPAFQNKGIGRKLLGFLLQKARMEEINKYFLEVRASNHSAIHLYESLGFEQISVRRDYYPALIGREDGLVYSYPSLSEFA